MKYIDFNSYMLMLIPDYSKLLTKSEIDTLKEAYERWMFYSQMVYDILNIFDIKKVKDKYLNYVEEMIYAKKEFELLLNTITYRLNININGLGKSVK